MKAHIKTNFLILLLILAATAALAAKPHKKPWVNKDARFFVEHYEESNHETTDLRNDFESGDFVLEYRTDNGSMQWDDGVGGKQSSDYTLQHGDSRDGLVTNGWSGTTTWPPTWWPTLVGGTYYDSWGATGSTPFNPVIVFQYRAQTINQDYSFVSFVDDGIFMFQGFYVEEGHIHSAPHAQVKLKFYAGGMGLPKRPNVYECSVGAVAHRQTGVTGIYKTPVFTNVVIAPQDITVGDLGRLDPDGILYVSIEDGSTKDITPKVDHEAYYTFGWPNLYKYELKSQVFCPALTDTNLERKTLGVAESVALGTLPDETTWSTTAGTLYSAKGAGNYFYAPHTKGAATVTATIRHVSLSLDFGIVEPSGIDHADITSTFSYGNGISAAGMHLNVYLAPTTVSFGAVQIYEVGQPPSNLTGYYLDSRYTPPGHGDVQGANVWQPVGCNNMVGNNFDNTYYVNLAGPWGQGGSFTWHVPVLWKVGQDASHSLTSWDQVFTLQANGTFTVSKFGHSVTRTINNQISTQ